MADTSESLNGQPLDPFKGVAEEITELLKGRIAKVEFELEKKRRKLEKDHQRFQKEKTALEQKLRDYESKERMISQKLGNPADILTLNIAGKHTLQVARSVLIQVEGSALAVMFSGRHEVQMKDGAYFIDRDVDTFCLVVSYLKNGCKKPEIDNDVMRKRFEEELKFWELDQPEIEGFDENDPNFIAL